MAETMTANHSSRKNWLVWARLAWFIILLLAIGKFAIGFPLRVSEYHRVWLAAEDQCLQGKSLTLQQVKAMQSAGLSLDTYAQVATAWEIFTSVVWAGAGLFIFILRPNERMALLVSAFMIMMPSQGFENHIRETNPSLALASFGLFNLGNILMFLFFALFPGGRFSPRWMRWYWLGAILISFLPTDACSLDPKFLPTANVIIILLWGSFLILGPYSQIYRYLKDSTAIERQQTKWIVMGFAFFAGVVIIGVFLTDLLPVSDLYKILRDLFLFSAANLIIPITITFSVLRYRLWDVSIIVRRTLQYTLVSGLLGLVYFGVITLMQRILTADGGPQTGGQSAVSSPPSAVVIVVTTLAIAALFNPLRKRIQDAIDRRFYRQKYDAEKALAEFAAAARSETDLIHLSSRLTSTVQETLQPELVGLWLKPNQKRGGSQPASPELNHRVD